MGKAGLRGQAGVAVPKTITHSWVACSEGAKAATAAAVLRALGSRGALLFWPLTLTLTPTLTLTLTLTLP